MRAREFIRVCRTVLALARGGPWAAVRALVRFLSAPLACVARYLPDHGRLVDAGCGQGHFLQYCALAGHESLVGFDLSMRGLRRARSVLPRRIALIQARVEELPLQECQAIVALDVLYLLDHDRQEAFLARAAAVLPPGGVLLIKTMAAEQRIRQWFNRLQEHVSVKVLRITLGKSFCFRTTGDWIALCERMGFHARLVHHWNGYLHPHVLIVAQRAHDTTAGVANRTR